MDKENKSKNGWGGSREGVGRKRITEDRLDIKLYMRVSEKEQLLIKEKAQQNNVSVSQYIRNAVLESMNKKDTE